MRLLFAVIALLLLRSCPLATSPDEQTFQVRTDQLRYRVEQRIEIHLTFINSYGQDVSLFGCPDYDMQEKVGDSWEHVLSPVCVALDRGQILIPNGETRELRVSVYTQGISSFEQSGRYRMIFDVRETNGNRSLSQDLCSTNCFDVVPEQAHRASRAPTNNAGDRFR